MIDRQDIAGRLIVRRRTEETSYGEILSLLHDAFGEYLRGNLRFTCSDFTVEDIIRYTKSGILMTALLDGKLVGMHYYSVFSCHTSGNMAYGEFLAVSPGYKRMGIASAMLEKELEILREMDVRYIIEDTAVGAQSSVCWHLRNGFRIVGLESYPNTKYYSYLFRLQLSPSIWKAALWCRLAYIVSYAGCRLCKRQDGSPTLFARLLKLKR